MRIKTFLITLLTFFLFSLGANAQFMFAEGTQIAMSDDSEKKIEDVLVGDIVLAFNYKDKVYEDKKVKSVSKTMLNRFVRITLETGKQVTLTADSPIIAEKGWASVDPEWTRSNDKYKTVQQCNPDDFILFYNVSSSDYTEIYTIQGILEPKLAYEIELDGGEVIVANGFLVGLN